ncbi:MAG: GDSL-type esterase/lipase family protein [Clostridiales bacterium]|nr:GDSL-type esterase/lipase family protein [Clostridiales bacterium]
MGVSKKRKKALKITIIAALVVIVTATIALTMIFGYPGRYINAKTRFDKLSGEGYQKNEILLIGSSFMEFWSTSGEDLTPLKTYNLGVASTVVSDWAKWIDKFVVPFEPRAVVIYVGSNDINGGPFSKSGNAVAEEVKALFSDIRDRLDKTEIYYISIAPTIAREKVWSEAAENNRLVREYCEQKDYLHFIDCTDALLNEDKSLKYDIYRDDDLHFNEKGYEIWKSVIAPVLINDLYGE